MFNWEKREMFLIGKFTPLRRLLIIIFHLFLFAASYAIAFLLIFNLNIPVYYRQVIFKTLPLLLFVKFLVFFYFGIFSGLWRYVSINDLWQILKANFVATLLFFCVLDLSRWLTEYPRSIFLLDFIICAALVAGVRFFARLLRERIDVALIQKRKKVLVIGAGKAGILILKEYSHSPNLGEIVGFIDDDPQKAGATIQGKKILGPRSQISQIVEKYAIEEIVLAIPSAKGELIRDIISNCQLPGVKLKIVPDFQRILSGEVEVKPREVKAEDLLGRETVQIDKKGIESYIKSKRILVTGAGGSIGSELCRQIIGYFPEKIILFDHNENDVYFLEVEFKTKFPSVKFRTIIGDIKDIGLLRHVFSTYKPDVVFHAAAHKHVPLMEKNPIAAVKNNVLGTRNLIYAATHYRVERFVLISTDKAVNPTSVMGATKRIAEMLLQAKSKRSATKFMAVRFGNVIGSDGSVVPLFKKQIEEGGPVTVTGPEVKRYFMSIPESVSLVLQAGALGEGGEIFILDMGEQIKVVDLAKNLIALSGLTLGKDIDIKYIGLRPGEKPYEEMLHNAEHDTTTMHNKIYITQSADYEPSKLRKKIKEMERASKLADEEQVIRLLSELVTTYKPPRETTS